jgi:hypothetical protein
MIQRRCCWRMSLESILLLLAAGGGAWVERGAWLQLSLWPDVATPQLVEPIAHDGQSLPTVGTGRHLNEDLRFPE